MKKVAGEDGASVGANESEDDADDGENGDERPGPAELRSMEKTEEHASDDDAGARAGLHRRSRVETEMAGHARTSGREERKEVAAEDGFFDQWSDENGHTHKEKSPGTILEKILDGEMVGRFDFGAGDGDTDGQPGAAREIDPGTDRPVGIGAKFFPAEGGPERPALQNGNGHIEKKKDEKKPEYVGTYGDIRPVLKKLLDFFRAEVAAGVEINDQGNLDDQDTAESKQSEKEKVKPGPGDAEIFWQESVGRRRRRKRGWRIGGKGTLFTSERRLGRVDDDASGEVVHRFLG